MPLAIYPGRKTQWTPGQNRRRIDEFAMTFQEKIVRDPAICSGQPVVRGTRVLVRTIVGYLAQGESAATILTDFPA